ncbi:MATE family efflux transporter [Allomeiothermus silvanus]|uniref:MATE family efflux transporter n=1 Tax=Allomeiothermus silvanus TaxID=52022 RepID=UPI0023F0389A|nr:MATE family efflux transporter [Allomeiothermus silvanus]
MDIHTRREIAKIAIPVGLESTFQLGLGFINQVIVGTLGTATIAAVGLANNVLFIGILCLNTLGAGCAILASRARGRGDEAAVSRISSLSLGFAITLAASFALPLALYAQPFLDGVGASTEVARIGGPYLSLVALSLPLVTASVVSSAVFRTLGHARLPMAVTMTAMALTPFLSWLFVIPLELGAVGAAWASLITQFLRAFVLVGLLFFSRWGIAWSWPSWGEARVILREMIPLVLPLFITEIVFSCGSFLFALLFERVSTEALAAFQIMTTLEGVFITAAIGLNSAATILVARQIGQANPEGIWRMSGSIWRLGLFAAAGLGFLFALTGFLLPTLYPHTTPQVQDWGFWAIVLNALFQPVKVSNMIFFGVLSSGGDTRYLLLSDVITVFGVGLPLAYLLAFPLGLGLWGIFLGRLLGEELVRISMFWWRYKSGRWFKLETILTPR